MPTFRRHFPFVTLHVADSRCLHPSPAPTSTYENRDEECVAGRHGRAVHTRRRPSKRRCRRIEISFTEADSSAAQEASAETFRPWYPEPQADRGRGCQPEN